MTEIKDELIEALLGCPTVVEFERRDALVRQLPENIRHNLKITNVARMDVIQLVDWCMNYQDGLLRLIEQLRFLEGNSLPMARVEEVWLRMQATPSNNSQRPQREAQETVLPAPNPAEVRGSKLRSQRLLVLTGIGVALAIAGVWFRVNNRQTTPQFTPSPSAPTVVVSFNPPGTTTASVPDTPRPATPGTARPTPIPPLPDVAPTLTTTVLLLSSPLCATEQRELEIFLADATNTQTPPVVLESRDVMYSLADDRAEVRSSGETAGADLVIWCTADDTGPEIHFEALTQRAAPEVYEPPTISMLAQPAERSQRAALGMIDYLRRDYAGAEPVLRTAIAMSSETKVTATLTLLIGNAQTFSHAYEAAADTYSQVVKAQPGWAFVWHNLGVAEIYAAWHSHDFEKALSAFEQARTIDPGFDLSLISIARIYRRISEEVRGSYEKAIAACEQAEKSKDVKIRAQGIACVYSTQLAGSTSGPSNKLLQYRGRVEMEDSATPYWAEPIVLIGGVEEVYWANNKDQVARQRARAYYQKYLKEAYDDVHLEESRKWYRDTIQYTLPQLNVTEP